MKNGVDIVKISRFENHLSDGFLKKYFSTHEAEYINSKPNKAETLAGIFAAKEAFLKALGMGIGRGVDLVEISILHDAQGAPFVEVTPKINYYLIQQRSYLKLQQGKK